MSLPRDRERDLERLLSDDGGELGALYRRLPKAEPPRRLDRSVLGEAARAVHGHTPRRQRWLMSIGSAAGIVLAAGIAWHVGQDALRRESSGPMPTPSAPRPNFVPVEPITEAQRKKIHEEAKLDATAPAPAATSAPAAPAAEAAKPVAPMQKAETRARASAPKPAPQPPAAAAPPPAVATPAPQAFPADTLQQEREQSADAAQEPAAQTGAAAAGAAAPFSDKQRSDGQRQDVRHRANAAPAPSSSVELRRDMQLAPNEWLGHVRQLMHQGRRQQAIESLRLFHNMHPEHAVPDDLRVLLD
jgi:hypothetical protein